MSSRDVPDAPTQENLFAAETPGEHAADEAIGLRNLRLDRPLAVLDLETTGTSPEQDRIVEVCAVVLRPGEGRDVFTRRVNPGIPIPPEATAVHGIRDADVAGEPPFRTIAPELVRRLSGADLAGFNILSYDLPLLEAELVRCDVPFSREGRRVVDAMRIFHLKEPRNLTAAVRLYAGREHAGAHGAEADVLATIEVLEGQLARYPDLSREVEGLARTSKPESWVDSQGKILWSGSEAVLGFGKHRGKPLRAMAREQRDYLEWILDRDFPPDTKALIREVLIGRHPTRDG